MLSKLNLTEDQNEAIDFAFERDYCLLSLPMGFGKTVVSLTAAAELIEEGVLDKVLVVAPARVRDLVWSQEHRKWEHLAQLDVTVYPDDSGRIVITSFNQLKDTLGLQYDGLIVDELTKLKTVSGAWFKSLRKYIKQFKWRVGLTGTLAEEGLDKLYAMAMVVDGGKALGRRKDVFMDLYFTPTDYMRYNWEPKPGAAEAIAHRLAPFMYTATGDDQQRPPLTVGYEFIDLSENARAVYEAMAKDMATTWQGDDIEAVNAAVLTGKLQQICNGFVYDIDRQPVELDRIKIEVAKDIISKHKGTLVVYQWQEQLDVLREAFPDAPVLGDGVSKKAANHAKEEWNAGRLNVLLVHPASAGHGLNLQDAGELVLFMNPIWSRDQTDQVIARLWRRGRVAPVSAISLVARHTVEDCVVVPRLMGKADAAASFRDHIVSIGA